MRPPAIPTKKPEPNKLIAEWADPHGAVRYRLVEMPVDWGIERRELDLLSGSRWMLVKSVPKPSCVGDDREVMQILIGGLLALAFVTPPGGGARLG